MAIFPNVPNVPGVPALARDVLNAVLTPDLLIADAVSFFTSTEAPQWGLFKDGVPVILADSVITMDYKQDWNLSSYPVEKGAFESYNKVQLPFGIKLRFATGGSEADREAYLNSIAAAAASLELFDVVTPEAIYTSVNVFHQDYNRRASNVGLIVVDVWCMEIRVTATAAFGNTQQTQNDAGGATPTSTTQMTVRSINGVPTIKDPQAPSASPQVNNGVVQPLAASPGAFDLSQALP